MVNLLIVESPAKCKKIASFLGDGWIVLATMGHIRALEETLDAVGLDRDFEPRFRFLKEKAKAMKPIMDAAEKASAIYLAADDDREGEAIAYSVACLLKRDPATMPRPVFHEITATAIRSAVENPRRLDMNVVYAQQARAVLDMLVGFTISPLLWKYVARSLSAGRCQTPALRLVSDREKAITSHSSQTTWKLSGTFSGFQSSMEDELEDQESALNYLENVYEDKRAVVTAVSQKQWTANPPKPLITSSLQQEASALYKINPKSTMKIAQSLYEAGHITYMRTDHAILSQEAIKEAQDIVLKEHGAEYVGASAASKDQPAPTKKTKKVQVADKPQAQEAHEAIRPTHFELKELSTTEDWSPHDRKVYALIHRRAMQSTMSQARGQTRKVTITLEGDGAEPKFPWTTSWRMTEFPGWQILGKQAKLDEDEEDPDGEDSPTWKQSLELKEGTKLTWTQLTAAPKRSKASPRFTEATLIRELEQRGIGRPSTFASLVEVLFDKLYVEKQDIAGTTIQNTTLSIKPDQWPPTTSLTQIALGAEKQKLVPTALGQSVITFCTKEFPQLFAYEFTAKMEERLDNVAKGKENWKALCRDTWTSYKTDYDRLNSKDSAPSSSEKVHDFGGGFKAVMSKTGPILVQESTFYSFPPNETLQSLTEEAARAWIKKQADDANMGIFDGKPIVKKKGPYGHYLQNGSLLIPYVESDTPEKIVEKFREKAKSAAALYKFGPYTFSRGEYGPYMYKHDLKTKVFIGIPEALDPKTLTAEEADAIYKAGVEAKKGQGGRGGRRGGFRGRGRG